MKDKAEVARRQRLQGQIERLHVAVREVVVIGHPDSGCFGIMAVGKRVAERLDAPAGPAARLQHRHLMAGLGEFVRCRKPGQPRPNNDHFLRRGGGREQWLRAGKKRSRRYRQGRGGHRTAFDKIAPGDRPGLGKSVVQG